MKGNGNCIYVNITGPAKSGKTRIAAVVKRTLEEHGIRVELDDMDVSETGRDKTLEKVTLPVSIVVRKLREGVPAKT